jgi:hypothetical protein
MNGLRILDTGLAPARWNVAMTATLAELRSRDAIGDTVRFHRYPACVLVGAGQDVQLAVDLEYCRRAGIAIARRVTGGGAVYMSPGVLAWDVVLDRADCGGSLDGVTREVCGGVAAGLSRLGAKARFRLGAREVEGVGERRNGRLRHAAQRFLHLMENLDQPIGRIVIVRGYGPRACFHAFWRHCPPSYRSRWEHCRCAAHGANRLFRRRYWRGRS